jgi:hypothetical protein
MDLILFFQNEHGGARVLLRASPADTEYFKTAKHGCN